MDKIFDVTEPLIAATSRMIQGFIEYLPQLVGGLLLLLLGWLVAKVLRAVAVRFAGGMDRVLEFLKLSHGGSTHGAISASTAAIIGNVVFWVVFLFFLTAATSVFGLSMFSGWLDKLIAHLPNILAGVLIVAAGVVLANLARDAVAAAMKSAPPRQRELLARIVQVSILVLLIIVGIDQIGIDMTIVTAVIGIVLGGVLFGLALAFGLGFRTVASNLIATRYIRNDYQVGDTVRIGDTEGKIIEVSFTAIVLDTVQGRMIVPARMFAEQISVLLQRGVNDG